MLDKKSVMFERDERGELIPVEITIDILSDKPKVLVTPLTKGELVRLFKDIQNNTDDKDFDLEIISKHCINPKFSEEELPFIKSGIASAISAAILSLSLGVNQEDVQNEKDKQQEGGDWLKKKLKKTI